MRRFNQLMKRLALWAGMLASIGACGGGGDSVSLDDFGAQALAAICAQGVACGTYPDLATCDDALYFNDQFLADVRAGRLVYDGHAAATCLDVYRHLPCKTSEAVAAFHTASEACDAVAKGTVPRGAACLNDEECVSGSCAKASCGTDACCMGACVDLVPAGASCNEAHCEKGLSCRWSSSAATATCVAPIPRGQPCASGDFCADSASCVTDPVSGIKSCGSLPATGAPCPDGSCDDRNDACDGVSKICVRRIPVGGACVAGHNDCVVYARCDNLTGTCLMLGRAQAPCAASDNCISGLRCEGGLCVAKPDAPACL